MTQTQTHKQDTADRRRSRVKATAGAVGAALAVWAVARFVLGIEIASPEFGPDQPSKPVGAVHVAGTALVHGPHLTTTSTNLHRKEHT